MDDSSVTKDDQGGTQPHPTSTRPWRVKNPDRWNYALVLDANGRAVVCDRGLKIPDNEHTANMALIVRAVNAHDDLVTALADMVAIYREGGPDESEPTCIRRALSALAKASSPAALE